MIICHDIAVTGQDKSGAGGRRLDGLAENIIRAGAFDIDRHDAVDARLVNLFFREDGFSGGNCRHAAGVVGRVSASVFHGSIRHVNGGLADDRRAVPIGVPDRAAARRAADQGAGQSQSDDPRAAPFFLRRFHIPDRGIEIPERIVFHIGVIPPHRFAVVRLILIIIMIYMILVVIHDQYCLLYDNPVKDCIYYFL